MNTWWNSYSVTKGATLDQRIGPLSLTIAREEKEWRIYGAYSSAQKTAASPIMDRSNLRGRFILTEDSDTLLLAPALADRPVVSQPQQPFNIPGHNRATIYISTILWVTITVAKESIPLIEIPLDQSSDTWFGPDTREGELCYAGKTSARVSIDNLEPRPHRAITPVQVYNEATTHLFIERINLPVPYLQLYADANGQLWTQAVRMTRDSNRETAGMHILPGPPSSLADARLVTKAREKSEQMTIIRKISGFFA